MDQSAPPKFCPSASELRPLYSACSARATTLQQAVYIISPSFQSKLQSQYLELMPIDAYYCLCAGSAFSPCQQCLPHIAPARPGCISKGGGPAGFSAPQVTTDICHSGTGEVSPNPKKSQQPQNRNLGKSFLSAQTTSALIRAGRKPVWV